VVERLDDFVLYVHVLPDIDIGGSHKQAAYNPLHVFVSVIQVAVYVEQLFVIVFALLVEDVEDL